MLGTPRPQDRPPRHAFAHQTQWTQPWQLLSGDRPARAVLKCHALRGDENTTTNTYCVSCDSTKAASSCSAEIHERLIRGEDTAMGKCSSRDVWAGRSTVGVINALRE